MQPVQIHYKVGRKGNNHHNISCNSAICTLCTCMLHTVHVTISNHLNTTRSQPFHCRMHQAHTCLPLLHSKGNRSQALASVPLRSTLLYSQTSLSSQHPSLQGATWPYMLALAVSARERGSYNHPPHSQIPLCSRTFLYIHQSLYVRTYSQ